MSIQERSRKHRSDEYRPHSLNQDDVLDLVKNPAQYSKYIDALMLLHEYISNFAPTQNRPHFDLKEINTKLERLQQELPPFASQNVEENYRLAEKIRKGMTSGRPLAASINEQNAISFSDGLLEIYTQTTTLERGTNPHRKSA